VLYVETRKQVWRNIGELALSPAKLRTSLADSLLLQQKLLYISEATSV